MQEQPDLTWNTSPLRQHEQDATRVAYSDPLQCRHHRTHSCARRAQHLFSRLSQLERAKTQKNTFHTSLAMRTRKRRWPATTCQFSSREVKSSSSWLKKAGRGISFRLSMLISRWLAVVSKDACKKVVELSNGMSKRYHVVVCNLPKSLHTNRSQRRRIDFSDFRITNNSWGRQLKCHLIRMASRRLSLDRGQHLTSTG